MRVNNYLYTVYFMNLENSDFVQRVAHDNGCSLHKQYSEAEAADILKISVSTLRRLRRTNQISHAKVGAKGIRHFGFQIVSYLINQIKCLDTA